MGIAFFSYNYDKRQAYCRHTRLLMADIVMAAVFLNLGLPLDTDAGSCYQSPGTAWTVKSVLGNFSITLFTCILLTGGPEAGSLSASLDFLLS